MSSDVRPGLPEFWRQLSLYEDATIQEAKALSERDFPRLTELSDLKATTLSRMLQLGQKAGLDRRNGELKSRLDALERAEMMNAESVGEMLGQARSEVDEMRAVARRLSSLRGAYASDVPPSGFFGEG